MRGMKPKIEVGRQGPPKSSTAKMVGYVHCSLSFTVVQQQARLVVGQLQLLGNGATEAARRREIRGPKNG